MLRWLFSLLILAPLTLVVVTFAASNRVLVTTGLFPLPFTLTAPLYLYVLGAFTLGLIAGAFLAWISGYKSRVTARRETRRAAKLEKDLAELRLNALRQDAPPASGSSSAPLLRLP